MMSIPAFLVLLVVLIGATWMSRRWGRSSEGRRPGHRHWITRSICGLLGTGIVAAFAVVTIQDARKPYAERQGIELQLPSEPPPELKMENGRVREGRFLLHVGIVSWCEGAMVPLYGRTYDVRWPQDADRSYHSTFESRGVKVTYQVSISEIRRYMYKNEMKMDVIGNRNVWSRGASFSSSSNGAIQIPEAAYVRYADDFVGPFSVTKSPSDTAALLLDFTPVGEEDPLRTGTFEEFLAIRGGGTWITRVSNHASRDPYWKASGSPAEALGNALQLNLFVLLAAAILFAQLFRRRSLAFVKVAACLLLYVGALDRVVLRIHESRFKDPAAPVEHRLQACAHLPGTTFFRKTALRDLEGAAADPSAPESLKVLAGRLAERGRRNHFP